MHIKLAPELNQAMNIMKYSVNHSWKFDYYRIAFFAGFLQAIMVISVEVINFVNLLLTNQILEIVMNFLALAVIADFDDFFYNALFDNQFKRVITDSETYGNFLLIQTTTSKEARFNVFENRIIRQEVENVHKDLLFPEYDRSNPEHSM